MDITSLAREDPVIWTYEYIRTEKRERVDFKSHPYQLDILSDMHPRIVIQKGSQVGITFTKMSKLLFLTDNYRITVIYTFPTAADVNKFSAARFKPMVQSSEHLMERMGDLDSASVKQIGDSTIYFAGSFSERQAISVPADILCFEPGTEILTRLGWKKIEDISFSDSLATRSDNGLLEWHPPRRLIKRKHDGELLRFNFPWDSSVGVTPEHEMVISDAKGNMIKRPANELWNKKFYMESSLYDLPVQKKKWFIIPGFVRYERPQGSSTSPQKWVTYPDKKFPYLAFCKFLGWYLSEGSVYSATGEKHRKAKGIAITQSTENNHTYDIRNTLDELGVDWQEIVTEKKHNFGQVTTKISTFVFNDYQLCQYLRKLGDSYNKYIPYDLLDNTYGLRELLERLHWGDGWKRGNYTVLRSFSPKLLDTVQIAWFLLGESSRLRYNSFAIAKVKRRYKFNTFPGKGNNGAGKLISQMYKGDVYCVSVKNHVILARTSGKSRVPFWVGQCHDEVDFSKEDVRETYSSRISHSDWKFVWLFSTPTLPEFGINAEFIASDQRNWLIKCTGCNHWQECRFPRNVRTVKRGGKVVRRYWGCTKCDKELDRTRGKWVRKYRNRGTHGYFIPPSICPWITPKYLYDLRRKIRKDKVFFNFHLGLPYASGVGVLSREILLRSSRDLMAPNVGEGYYMGVDQGDELHIEISRYNNGRREVVYYETAKEFSRVGQLMDTYGIRYCIIDALPNKHSARELAKSYPNRMYMAYYSEIKQESRAEEKRLYRQSNEANTILIDRSESLDAAADQWIKGESIILAADGERIKYDLYDDERHKHGWLQQMCNMKRDVDEDSRGDQKVTWVKIGPDHWRHADLYNYIAWKMDSVRDDGEIVVGGRSSVVISNIPGEMRNSNLRESIVAYTEYDTDDIVSVAGAAIF